MSYKIYLWDALSAIEWSQASWRSEVPELPEPCDRELIHDVILRHLPPTGLVVDAGCGTAKWPIYLRGRGYRCVGIEISRDACRLVHGFDRALPLVCGDGRHVPLRTASADVVLSLGVVEHDEAGPLASLREIRRILKPDGLLVLAVPFNNLLRRLLVNHLQTYVTWRRRRADMRLGFAEYRFTKREVRRFLHQSGFAPVATYPNDLLPPRVMGLWVDRANLVVNPLAAPAGPAEQQLQFMMAGLPGRIARALVRRAPWLVCGEVVFVARAR